MTLSVLTYNILYNKALVELQEIIKTYSPDIICLQEIDTNEQNLRSIEGKNYQMANFSNSFIQFDKIYGLVTYYRKETLSFVNSFDINLTRSFIETLRKLLKIEESIRSILKTEFIFKPNHKKITIYNIHCSMWSTNNARNKQIVKIFADIQNGSSDPVIVAGDFNYPYGRKKFETLINKYGLKEATNNIYYTFEMKLLGFIPVKWKNDYILYRHIKCQETKRIKVKSSDHYPVISTFEV